MLRTFRLLSLRQLARQPLRAAIAAIAVAAGVALVVSIDVTATSVDRSIEAFGRSLSGPAPLRIVGATPRGGLVPGTIDAARGVAGVDGVVPVVQATSFADGGDQHDVPVLVLGVDCSAEALVGPFGCDPEAFDDLPDAPIAVGPGMPAGLTVRTSVGRMAVPATAPLLDGLAGVNDGRVVVLPLGVAQRRFLQEDRVDLAYVTVEAGADVDAVRDDLAAAVGDHNGVLTTADATPETEFALNGFLPLFSLLGLFGLATGAVLVRNTVALSLEERRRQLAITGALGAPGRTLVLGVLGETALLGVVGGVLGAGLGFVVAGPVVAGVSSFTEEVGGVPIDRYGDLAVAVRGAVLGAVVAALAAIGPARRATRLDVAADLSGRSSIEDDAPPRLVRRLLRWCAVAAVGVLACWAVQRGGGLDGWQAPLAGPAFLLVDVGLLLAGAALAPMLLLRLAPLVTRRRRATWLLAFAELTRDAKRTGVLAVALASPIIVGFAVDGFVASARAGIAEELTAAGAGLSVSTVGVDGPGDAFLSPEAQAALLALPGVAGIDQGSYLTAGQGIGDLMGVETTTSYDLTDLDLADGTADQAAYDAGGAVIGAGLARREGVRAGDALALATPAGRVDVEVVAVEDGGDFGGVGVNLHPDRYAELYGTRPPAFLRLRPAPGVSEAALDATVDAAAPSIDPELVSFTTAELLDEVVRSIDDQMLPFRAMQQSLLLVAFVAVLSTLLLAGLQRRRELGLLGAVGADPAALRRVVLAEAVVVTGAAAVDAAVASPIVLWSMLQVLPFFVGIHDPFRADWSSLVTGIAVAGVGALLGAAWPAWRAGRTEVLDALRYE